MAPMAAGGKTALAAGSTADQAYVIAVYQDFLGRKPTEAELNWWSAAIGSGTSGRSPFVNQLANSNEWVGHIVTGFYQETLGRDPDTTGLNYWTGQIISGRQSVAQVAASFYSSSEYFVDTGRSDLTTWVQVLYQTLLNRSADQPGLEYWVAQAEQYGRLAVAYAFYQSSESAQHRVTALYEQLLARLPDKAGLAFWAQRIVVTGDVWLAATLASSDEFYNDAQVPQVTVPGPPTGVQTLAGDGQVVLSWTAPADDGGAAITGYTVTSNPEARTCSTTGTTSCVVADLTNGTTYTFTVTAISSTGESPASYPSAQVTPVALSGTWTVLTAPQGASISGVIGVNTAGMVAGSCGCAPGLVWSSASAQPEMVLAPDGYRSTSLTGMNDDGEFVGSGIDPSGVQQALVWSSALVQPRVLATPPGYIHLEPVDINNNGEVIGYGVGANGEVQGFVWSSESAQPTPLLVPPGYTTLRWIGVNDSGEILGTGYDANGHGQGFVWSSASAQPTLLPVLSQYDDISPVGLNNAGEIIGYGFGSGSPNYGHGLVWSSASAQPTSLSVPAGYSYAEPVTLNDAGEIVGVGMNSNGQVLGATWSSASAQPTALPVPLGHDYVRPVALSDSGQIAARGVNSGGGSSSSVDWLVYVS